MANDPDIFAYADFRAFLKDWLDVPPRSLVFLQRRSGISKSHLSNVVSGARRLTSTGAEHLAAGLRLGILETRYFLALVAASDADTERQREEAQRALVGMARFRSAEPIVRDRLALISVWYVPVVLELARLPGFELDPARVARQVVPAITTTQAEEALGVLTRLGVLSVAEDGSVTVSDEVYATHHQVVAGGAEAAGLQRQWLTRAGEALDLPHEERQFGAVTLTIDPARMAEFKAEIERFLQRIIGLERPVRTDRHRVYQLCVQFFAAGRSNDDLSQS